MRIGVISDTHDNIPKIKKAVSFFNSRKVDLVLHAGDYIAPFSVIVLNRLKCPYLGVFGNNDGEKKGLAKKSADKIKAGPLETNLLNKKILLVHDLAGVSLRKKYDLVIHGHTHIHAINTRNSTLLINPGECCGWLTGKSTLAIVELPRLSAKIFKI